MDLNEITSKLFKFNWAGVHVELVERSEKNDWILRAQRLEDGPNFLCFRSDRRVDRFSGIGESHGVPLTENTQLQIKGEN